MKIAITADNHLTTIARNPERFKTMENIFNSCGELGVKLLIIAGDLFDQNIPNYAEFETLYNRFRPPELTTAIIPGNHDSQLIPENITGDDLFIYNNPSLLPLNQSWNILFVPFQQKQTMGSVIATFAGDLTNQRWILVGHGDWSPGIQIKDRYEPGVYMPLTRSDLIKYKPEIVFLGHIHLAYQDKNVNYPGSPCPVDHTETGLRSFLVLDLKSGKIERELVDSPVIHFEERFVMIPHKDELDYLKGQVRSRIESWDIPPGWDDRVRVQVTISGIAADRKAVQKLIQDEFSSFQLDGENNPNLKQLYHLSNPDLDSIALRAQDWISSLDWEDSPESPTKPEILEEALKIIYGVD